MVSSMGNCFLLYTGIHMKHNDHPRNGEVLKEDNLKKLSHCKRVYSTRLRILKGCLRNIQMIQFCTLFEIVCSHLWSIDMGGSFLNSILEPLRCLHTKRGNSSLHIVLFLWLLWNSLESIAMLPSVFIFCDVRFGSKRIIAAIKFLIIFLIFVIYLAEVIL